LGENVPEIRKLPSTVPLRNESLGDAVSLAVGGVTRSRYLAR
jgi:hypothetical protein